MSSAAITDCEKIKRGRRAIAEILTHENGARVLVVNRTMRDIQRGGDNVMISHAIKEGEAYWPVETLLLSMARRQEIPYIAIRIRASKSVYVTTLACWIKHSKLLNNRLRSNSMQRSLSLRYFRKREGLGKL